MFDRTQGFDYIPQLAKNHDNILYNAEDGTVWACYLLQGLNTNPYNLDKVTACQRGNSRLFTQLSHVPASEFLLLGAKAQTNPDTIMARSSAGIPALSSENYPELREQFDAFYKKIVTGELAENSRPFVLCIGLPTRQSFLDRMLSGLAVIDPHRKVEPRMIAELEPQYFRAIPPEFRPIRINADHLAWVFDRARLRGITVPVFPDDNAPARAAVSSVRSFPQVVINKNADTDALYEDFLDKAADSNPQLMARGQHRVPRLAAAATVCAAVAAAALSGLGASALWVTMAAALTVLATIALSVKVGAAALDSRKVLRDSFPTTRWSRAISVHDVQHRSQEFPDGYTSYQTQVAIGGYPTAESFSVNAFTYLVDQEIGEVDADFAIRFDYDQTKVTKAGLRKLRKELDAEDLSNSEDELDAADYAERRGEMGEFHAAIKSESGARGMRVVGVFSFAHQNLTTLTTAVDDIIEHFVDQDFTPVLPVGGQYDLWKAMMPGSSCPPVLDDLKCVTTTRLFGAFMPVRRTVIGDPVGMPIAVNKENTLGQIVHRDLLHATDRGNASIAVIGAPNAGKSNLLKLIAAYMVDLKRPVHLVDQDPDGEQEVFAHSITDPEIIHVTQPHRSTGGASLDPLKCYPPEKAAGEFLRLWMPLLGISRDRDKAKAALLAQLVSPEYRTSAQINSTRELLDRLTGGQGGITHELAAELAVGFDYWARQPYTAAFIDPMVEGKVATLAPFNSSKLLVVFRTHELKVHRPTPGAQVVTEESDEELFARMAYTAVAALTAWRFHNTPGPCMFGGDELRFLKGATVLRDLVEQPDRMGRKSGNFVVVAAQLAADLDEHTAAIECKAGLRQGTESNAAGELQWMGMPRTERLIKRVIEDTSPLDPATGMPEPTRRGEGWVNFGGDICAVQTLDHFLTRRRRFSDTTASTRIRDRDLPAIRTEQTRAS